MSDSHKDPLAIPDKLYFKIGEVAALIGVEPYVLRYWETEFPEIRPVKSRTNQRLYKRQDVQLISTIRDLLYQQKFTIDGARRKVKEGTKGAAKSAANADQMRMEFAASAENSRVVARLRDAVKSVIADMNQFLTSF